MRTNTVVHSLGSTKVYALPVLLAINAASTVKELAPATQHTHTHKHTHTHNFSLVCIVKW